jgi:formylglycine-generating enzyme required for sulfatase activity
MEAIFFQPETSIRRALILALGTYGPEALPSAERSALTGKLLDLYKNDPDAGVHGAAEWTLRQWHEQSRLQDAAARLPEFNDRGERRWFVSKARQTFVLIHGPVEFAMGSPPFEPDRYPANELPHRRVIPRRFAIAAKEVNVEQWQRFERTHAQHELPPSFVKRFRPDPDCPMVGITWYVAANYCNWLSEQEGLPRDQWCYLPNESGAFAEGMTIPADVLKRIGYRLPTDAEWEYACRCAAVTSYPFGLSSELLDKYAWYQANSQDHAWSCGSLLPNDLGLFDMLGN